MGFGTREFVVVAVIATLCVTPTLLASCGTIECSKAAPDATFVGHVTGLTTGAARFTIETVTIAPGASPAHVPVVGASITVAYGDGQERFLRVGQRYSVQEVWSGGQFASGVHVASDACSGGTVHADGSGIDTSSRTAKRARHFAVALAIAPIVALLVLTTWLFLRRRGRRVDARA